jgi:O-antigen/teichoic acid export membrane protein
LASRFDSLKALSSRRFALLRLKEFDTSSQEGRSKERYRRVGLTALSAGGAKIVSILSVLISVPLTLNYLGVECYGMWMTISSVVVMMGFADLGLGLGLMNAVSVANGEDDREAAIHYVSSAFFMLCTVAICILVFFILIYPFIQWDQVFNVKSPSAKQEAGPAMAAFVLCFVLNLPAGIAEKIQLGYQEGFVTNFWEGIGKFLGLLGVLVVIYYHGRLFWLVLAMAGAPVLAASINCLILFCKRRPWLRPKWQGASFNYANKVIKIGVFFFIQQVVVAISYNSDNIIAAQILGPEAVTQYSVPMRMFSMLSMVSILLVTPLWPAYGEAMARKDFFWAKRTLIRSLLLTLIVIGLPSLGLVILGNYILYFWVGDKVIPALLLLLGLGLWTILASLGNCLAMFLNGAHIIKFPTFVAVITALGAISAKIFLTKTIGISGIIWGTIIAYIFLTCIPLSLYLFNRFSRIEYINLSIKQ